MFITFEDRSSDSSLVERVWRSHSERAGTFLSMAASHWVMVVTRLAGRTFLTVRGPETRATSADCPADGQWIGVNFKLGTFMPLLPGVFEIAFAIGFCGLAWLGLVLREPRLLWTILLRQ